METRPAPLLILAGALLCAPIACVEPEPRPGASAPTTDAGDAPAAPDAGPAPSLACTADGALASGPSRLLTRFEYDNTVRDLLFDDTRPAAAFPAETSTLGFDNNAEAHRANPTLVQAYLEVAEDIAARAVAERLSALLPCDPASDGEVACGEAFARSFAARAFRRPVSDDEVQIFLRAFDAERQRAGFEAGIEAMIQVALMSPQLLYRLEPVPAGDANDVVALGPYELASRLSYFLWGSMPDDALLEAAETGALSTREGVEAEARRLLADPRAKDAVRHFHAQWLLLDGLSHLVKDDATYPSYTPALRAVWREEMDRFIEHVWFDSDGTLEELLTSPVSFVDATLAAFYDVEGPSHDGFAEVTLDPATRAGLLTRPGLLAVLANPDQSSPIRRGVFVRERLFCDALPPPPDDLAIIPPDPDPNATTRERFAEHTANEACVSCHQLIDPVGFGFERYDGIGRYRSTENGLPIDASGELVAVDEAIAGPFDGAVELSQKLAGSVQVKYCVATQWFRFAAGRLERSADSCSLDDVRARFSAGGGDLKELLVAIAASDAFRFRKLEATSPSDGRTLP